jgi:flagellar basal body P-ring protein FlgI
LRRRDATGRSARMDPKEQVLQAMKAAGALRAELEVI